MHAIMAATVAKAARSLAAPKNKRQAQRRMGLYEALTDNNRGPVARIAMAERDRLQGFLATGKYGRGMTPGRADDEKHRADRAYREEVKAGAGKPVARLAAAKPSATPAPADIDPQSAYARASRRFVEADAAHSANRREGMRAGNDKAALAKPLRTRAQIDAERDKARAALAQARADLDALRERARLASLPPAEEMRAANDQWLAAYRRKSDKALGRKAAGGKKMHPILKSAILIAHEEIEAVEKQRGLMPSPILRPLAAMRARAKAGEKGKAFMFANTALRGIKGYPSVAARAADEFSAAERVADRLAGTRGKGMMPPKGQRKKLADVANRKADRHAWKAAEAYTNLDIDRELHNMGRMEALGFVAERLDPINPRNRR
jgi:hypothetical protein